MASIIVLPITILVIALIAFFSFKVIKYFITLINKQNNIENNELKKTELEDL